MPSRCCAGSAPSFRWRNWPARSSWCPSPTFSRTSMAFAFMYRGGKQDAQGTPAWERSLDMARAFGLTVVTTAPNPLTLAGACIDAGKPAFMVEMTRARMLDEHVVQGALRGTRNVLVQLGMLDGAIEPQEGFLIVPGVRPALPTLRANRGGFITFEVECGVPLAKGTVIATIRDVFGAELEAVRMDSDGYVMTFPPVSWTGHCAVATGDLVADIFA
jgi:predicted deacylase